jgi:hypothetical protein
VGAKGLAQPAAATADISERIAKVIRIPPPFHRIGTNQRPRIAE